MKHMHKITETLKTALLRGGKILSAAMKKPKKISYKGQANLVTETDGKVEQVIIKLILQNFPDHAVLAEESESGSSISKSPYRWIIDPVDGTTNFAHGLPLASVSIGFEDHGAMTVG